MIRGVSLDWLETISSTSKDQKILVNPVFGLELAFFPAVTTLEICTTSDEQRAWGRLLISSMEHLKRTGLETLLGLNKAGRRVFLYHQLREFLDEDTRRFWDNNEKEIRVGILVDENLERSLSKVRYPHGSVRWNLLGQLISTRWLSRHTDVKLSPKEMFARLSARKQSMWGLPWRYERLLENFPEHQKKSIIPKIDNIYMCNQDILDRIKNAEQNSIDVFLLWDAVEHLDEIWSYIERAGTHDSFVLVASRESEPSWWDELASNVVTYTLDAHFSFGRVTWLRVHQKSDIHTLK